MEDALTPDDFDALFEQGVLTLDEGDALEPLARHLAASLADQLVVLLRAGPDGAGTGAHEDVSEACRALGRLWAVGDRSACARHLDALPPLLGRARPASGASEPARELHDWAVGFAALLDESEGQRFLAQLSPA